MSDYLETAAITGLLTRGYTRSEAAQLSPDYFTVHRRVYDWVVAQVAETGLPPSLGATQALFPGFTATKKAEPFQVVLEGLRRSAIRRALDEHLSKAVSLLYSDNDGPEKALSYLQSSLVTGFQLGDRDVLDLTTDDRLLTYKRRRDAYLNGTPIGVPTGFTTLDKWFHGGLQPGELYLILGATGVGKTWTGLVMATAAWRAGHVPVYFLLEGAPEAAGYRFDTLLAQVPNSDLFVGSLDYDAYEAAVKGAIQKETGGRPRPFWLATMGSQEEYTVSNVWHLAAAKRPALVVVDYLTLMTVEGERVDDWRTASTISRQLAAMAVRLNVPVLAIVQGTKGTIGKSTLGLEDVAVAYAITRPASNVIGVSNGGNGIMKYEHLKGRHIDLGGGTSGAPAFYVKANWNVGGVVEDSKRVL